ncbi:flagellar basal-body rod protein FlgB [Shewanella denitrificans OS217]|jgi:flagellar basal-body rod protein FlgB|uniref:Flagellar basal body rod protein FlgB n=1 Tax=Shewanella denitrificans (strain OS217 / ATCC BAA-1090 / DSM 15013) TaxID=318161 RepID=Q12PN7_SHEDO|nr:flagellar basal body rod protein FlgB [Shewanella denitrificans]ABE54589.1 flagellar basal-body rod protein FlgB [Shewanella denitrificans OS217]
MAINFENALGVHQYSLGIRSQRAEVLSSNIANANTPHYKAQDVDFASAMQSARSHQKGLSMSNTSEKHFDLTSLTQQHIKYRVPNQPDTGDGNTVDIQKEQSSFMQNALEYQMSLGFLEGKFSGMRKALRGD